MSQIWFHIFYPSYFKEGFFVLSMEKKNNLRTDAKTNLGTEGTKSAMLFLL